MGATLADRLDQVALLEKARRGIVLDGFGELYLEIVVLLVARRYADARGRLALVVGPRERENQRQCGAIRKQGSHIETVARPFSLQAGHQRAFERGMRLLFEQIHQGHALQGVIAGVAEQLKPGTVGVDDDAFLHMGDCVRRTLEKILQLLPVFARRRQRIG